MTWMIGLWYYNTILTLLRGQIKDGDGGGCTEMADKLKSKLLEDKGRTVTPRGAVNYVDDQWTKYAHPLPLLSSINQQTDFW